MPLGYDLIDKAIRADECLTLANRMPPKDEIYELPTTSGWNNDSLADFKKQLLMMLNKTGKHTTVIEKNSDTFEFVLIHIIELAAICVMMIFYSTLNYMKRTRHTDIELDNL